MHKKSVYRRSVGSFLLEDLFLHLVLKMKNLAGLWTSICGPNPGPYFIHIFHFSVDEKEKLLQSFEHVEYFVEDLDHASGILVY